MEQVGYLGKDLLGQLLQSPDLHTLVAPSVSGPAMAYSGLKNIGRPAQAQPYQSQPYDYSSLLGGY